MNITRILGPILAVALLGGCVSNTMGPNQQMGTLIGAGAGALAGAHVGSGNGRLAAVAIGTLAGAYAGSQFGAGTDNANAVYYNQRPAPVRTVYRPARYSANPYRQGYRDGRRDGRRHGYRRGYNAGSYAHW